MLRLFHRAWAQADPTANLDRPGSNRFDLYVGALLGIGQTALQNRESIPDRAKLQYAGWLSNPVRCADGLRAILEDYFEIPVSIEEFRGEWLPIPHDARLALGGPAETSALGRTAVVGRRAYSVQDRFRVCAGPLTRDELCRFLPGSPSLVRLEALVRSYAGDELSWDLRLRLRPDADCQVRLGGGERLAYNARVGSGVAVADVIIDPTTRQRPHAEN
jgi:type VI secretion system protein ImpH